MSSGVQAKQCPPLSPPSMGLLKCQTVNGNIRCLATCYNNQIFDTKETVVVRTCDPVTGTWREGPFLPVCEDMCNTRLLTVYSSLRKQVVVSASSDVNANDVIPLGERSLLGNRWDAVWRPSRDGLDQFIQVELPTPHRINGIVVKGDGDSDYVTYFRVLVSANGVTWYPYSDGKIKDKFIRGNTNSQRETTAILSCPQEAKYVRINPVTWSKHLAMTFDLIGCAVPKRNRMCHPVSPPPGGVVNCEIDGEQTLRWTWGMGLMVVYIRGSTTSCQHVFCTAYCDRGKVFKGDNPVISTSCNETSGIFDVTEFPPCIDDKTPTGNRSIFCIEHDLDCDGVENGDYQYCGDCHYFSTCVHGYFYVRACPALLQFDSEAKLCDYKSKTCSSLRRRFWLAERRMQSEKWPAIGPKW